MLVLMGHRLDWNAGLRLPTLPGLVGLTGPLPRKDTTEIKSRPKRGISWRKFAGYAESSDEVRLGADAPGRCLWATETMNLDAW